MRIRPSSLLAALCLVPSLCFGLGFRLADMDSFATGRGNAFTATADNPSAIYYNPAGIVQMDGLSMRLGAYGIGLSDEFHPSTKGANSVETTTGIQAVPQTYVVYHPENSPIAVGYGAYSPYGLGIRFPDDSPFRTLGLGGKIAYETINPVAALQVSRSFAVAAGFTANYSQAELFQGIMERGDLFKFKGDGLAFGFTLGALWQPTPQHSFGITYHSATDVTFSGHTSAKLSDHQRAAIRVGNAQIRALRAAVGDAAAAPILAAQGVPFDGYSEKLPQDDADAEVHFPQFIRAGYSFRPTPDWNFEFNVDWTDWDSLNVVTLHQQSRPDALIPFNYESSFMWDFGATRYLAHGFHLSTGYMFSENSVPDSQFSPSVPDSDRHVFAVGVGQKAGRYAWDLAYQLAYGPTRTVNNDNLADGRYRFLSHAITLSLGYTF